MSRHYDRALAAFGLTVGQFAILAELEDRRAVAPTIGRLAVALSMDPAGLRHTLGPLIRDGLLMLGRDRTDRRATIVTITDAGLAKLRQATPAWSAAQTAFEVALGAHEASALRSLLAVTDRVAAAEALGATPDLAG